MMYYTPKGFFPIQDIGLINGISEAAQDISPAGDDAPAAASSTTSSCAIRTSTALARRSARPSARRPPTPAASSSCSSRARSASCDASQVIDRLRPQLAKVTGATPVPAAGAGHHGRRPHRARGSFQYTLQDPNIAELTEWSQKMLDKMKTLPEIVDVEPISCPMRRSSRSPSIATRPSRFGISAADDRRHAQRCLWAAPDHAVFHPAQHLLDHSGDHAGAAATSLDSLDRIYVKSPLTGAAVPLSALVDVDSNKVGPLPIIHQGAVPGRDADVQPARRGGARRGGRRHHGGGARDRHADLGHRHLPGQRPGVPDRRCRASRR